MKKLLVFSMLCLMTFSMNAQSYVDLGLSSGTKWKSANEKDFYSYSSAMSNFGRNLPTKEQWMELEKECEWTWSGMGYKVVGPNGNFISLPAAGSRDCYGRPNSVGSYGSYWSSTPYAPSSAMFLYFNSSKVYMRYDSRCCGRSVRLVQD